MRMNGYIYATLNAVTVFNQNPNDGQWLLVAYTPGHAAYLHSAPVEWCHPVAVS